MEDNFHGLWSPGCLLIRPADFGNTWTFSYPPGISLSQDGHARKSLHLSFFIYWVLRSSTQSNSIPLSIFYLISPRGSPGVKMTSLVHRMIVMMLTAMIMITNHCHLSPVNLVLVDAFDCWISSRICHNCKRSLFSSSCSSENIIGQQIGSKWLLMWLSIFENDSA